MSDSELYAGRTALVTGASAGLGAAYARGLAQRGADLVLVARRRDRLQALAGEIEGLGRRARVVTADLSKPEAPAAILEEIGAAPDILINNAGFGLPGTYANTSWPEQRDFLQLMVTACAELAHHANMAMHERGWGRIVNVASLAGIVPGSAGHTLYGASKAFLISFSQSLAAEGESAGVRAQACCPGFTYTEFHDVNGTRERMKGVSERMWMEAGAVTEGSLDALEDGPVVYVPGRVNQAIARSSRLMGPELAAKVMNKQSKAYRRTEGGMPSSGSDPSSSSGSTTTT
ncbi:SDR family NAD(P)-dependent oxidoreductase [Parvularcula oceani]|uniref:SDR family NAD(P)-dependent oxidoreductase n=1 Tax=Parvularcula oceani TaxID=1247963 RepID=UPI0009DE7554|nr:SDR family oxidoreductase [Parvularcula oceani]